MKSITHLFSKKQIGLMCLLIAITVGAGYFVYDKYFAKKMMIASINPYNFTDIDIADIYVNGTWGGSSYAHTGGSSSVCCVLVPEKWRPGLVVNVKWQRDDNEKWYTAQAEIPEYKQSAGLQVLFLKNNQIKVYLQDYWPCTPMHPMPKDKELCGEPEKS
jgi:hypothetical protein